MKLLILFLVIVLIKFVLNLYNFLRIKKLCSYHLEFLSDKRPDFTKYRQEVLSLFKKAHIKNVCTPATQPVGYGKIATMNVDVFTMFPSNLQIIAVPAHGMFNEAQGVFKKNMCDSINPIYWLDFLVFLPKNILIYLGLDTEKTLFKIINLGFTFLWWSFCTLVTIFQPEIKQFIVELFGNSK